MSPIELVEMVTSRPGYTHSVGTKVLIAEPGQVCLALDRRPDLLQFNGYFHGGVIAGLADHAAGGAVTTALPDGQIAITIDMHVNFLSPADGPSILARAKAVQVGKTVSVAKVDITTERENGEQLCALCTVTLRTVPLPFDDVRKVEK